MSPRLRACSLLVFAAAVFGGCTTVKYDPSGDTMAVYQFGEFKMLLNTTAPKAAEATARVLEANDLYVTQRVVNRFDARFTARARNDQRILVIIQEANSAQTLVRIRWGEGGNLGLSRRLFDQIEAQLR